MSIKNKTLYSLTEKILKEEIQNGNLPSSKEFLARMSKEMRGRDLSMPSFSFKPYRPTEIASSSKYNQDSQRIYDDFSVLYSNIIDVNNVLDKYFTAFGIEKDKIETDINKSESELIERINNYKKGGYLGYSFDAFDDTNKVSMEKSKDIYVDTRIHETRIIEEKNTSKRIIPNGEYNFKILNEKLRYQENVISADINNIFKDDNSLIWQTMYSLEKDVDLTGVLIINLDSIVEMNKIFLDMITVKECKVKIEFSTDSKNWYDLPYYENYIPTQGNLSFDFPTMKIKQLKIYIQKTNSDEQSPKDGFDYHYLFGIKNLDFYNKNYPTYAVLESLPLDINNKPNNYQINNVRLIADEVLPTGTDIKYSIAIYNKDKELDWQTIDPINRKNSKNRQIISFSNIKKNNENELFFPEEYSVTQSEAEDLRANGMPIYRLSNISNGKRNLFIQKKKIIDNTLKLYVGKNSWEITSFPSNDVEQNPDIQDWIKVNPNTEIDYIPLENTKSGIIFDNFKDVQKKKYMCKIGLFVEGGEQIIKSYPVSTDPMSIYLNGDMIFNGETSMDKYVNFVLNPGWNELVVFINGKNATSVNGISASLGFNPHIFSQDIYASPKSLKEISVFDLQYNTKMNNREVFAKRETDDGIEILVNFGKPGMKFDLYYDYSEDINNDNDKMVLKAEFIRENSNTIPSPKLTYYRLEYS